MRFRGVSSCRHRLIEATSNRGAAANVGSAGGWASTSRSFMKNIMIITSNTDRIMFNHICDTSFNYDASTRKMCNATQNHSDDQTEAVPRTLCRGGTASAE